MIAQARSPKQDALAAEKERSSGGVLLHDISWDLYERLLQATEEQHVRMTYDRGELEISPALVRGISWNLYEELVAALDEQHVHMTYDAGDLEFMAPMPRHERGKVLVRSLVEALAYELGMDYACFGSMTCKRKDLKKGLEPDECYYIQSYKRVWNKDDLDFAVDPPPDLAIEMDNTTSSVGRQGIYAALGVPELWRYDGRSLRVFHLAKGAYSPKKKSLAFPKLPMAEFERFLGLGKTMKQHEWLTQFREWVRRELKK